MNLYPMRYAFCYFEESCYFDTCNFMKVLDVLVKSTAGANALHQVWDKSVLQVSL